MYNKFYIYTYNNSMAGSSSSNLGYGNIQPYNNSPFVNGTSANNPANFGSNESQKV